MMKMFEEMEQVKGNDFHSCTHWLFTPWLSRGFILSWVFGGFGPSWQPIENLPHFIFEGTENVASLQSWQIKLLNLQCSKVSTSNKVTPGHSTHLKNVLNMFVIPWPSFWFPFSGEVGSEGEELVEVWSELDTGPDVVVLGELIDMSLDLSIIG